ncbi:hypothetical protein SKAU_G00411120 [Synaphobranchus kaupii]|uniref:Peptidase aspartic putative domain-containing protein n=1 Tax=Synaphobranchus kaupii TaxID=118154 RepID=A0A9Q1I9T5_SYNKA|nr:hypothetical protein SKAU_G00411120 [Synaphobranchus kaupii]
MPDDRLEIPSAEIAHHYPHLKPVMDKIPAIDHDAAILLLLGRDILRIHKVRKQYNGPNNTPYAQQLDIGWVIVGEVCLRGVHKPSSINVYRTNVLPNGRTSFLSPCASVVHIKEKFDKKTSSQIIQTSRETDLQEDYTEELGSNIFERTKDDEKIALSIEDKAFLAIMDKNVYMNDANSWVAPLPFRSLRSQIRVVFDSSAKYQGISLNDILLKGPDLNNTLLGVLIRFRREPIAVTTDVQQMFYCFTVCEDHRDFLRFL